MGIITALEPQKRKKGRVNVFIDGEFRVGLSLEICLKNGLQVGKRVSPERLEKLIKENELDQILAKVYKFLSYRPRTEKEISDYLTKKEAGPLLTDLVIKTLKKQKYLDDREFARWWIEQRTRFRPRGKRVLRAELFKKGISQEIIEEALDLDFSTLSSKELALKAIEKKLPAYKKLGWQESRRKVGAFLARRGFDWETIKTILEEMGSA